MVADGHVVILSQPWAGDDRFRVGRRGWWPAVDEATVGAGVSPALTDKELRHCLVVMRKFGKKSTWDHQGAAPPRKAKTPWASSGNKELLLGGTDLPRSRTIGLAASSLRI